MKKKEFLITLTVMAALGMGACGNKGLTLVADSVELELGSEPDTAVTSYVELDEKAAEDAVLDFSGVDIMTVGTYTAYVTYKEQTAGFEVVVVDTTAPVVEVIERVAVSAGEALYAADVITGIIELGGSVETAFEDVEETVAASQLEEMEALEPETEEETEVVEPGKESLETEDTEAGMEEPEAETENQELPAEDFIVDGVLCSNASVVYQNVGEYDNVLTVTDASGNSASVTVHIIVGEAPEFSGIADLTVTVGAEEIDYLDGVTAVDCNGNDITDRIVCDSASIDLEAAGEYVITYTVEDENGFAAEAAATVTVEEEKSKKTASANSSSMKTGTSTAESSTTESSTNTISDSTGTSGDSGSTGSSSTSSGSDISGSSTSGSSDSGNSSTSSSGSDTSDISGSSTSGSSMSGNTSGSDTSGNSASSSSDTSESSTSGTPQVDTADNWWESDEYSDFIWGAEGGSDDGTDLGGGITTGGGD